VAYWPAVTQVAQRK